MYFRTNRGRATRVSGWELDYFNSEEWLNVQDKLDERDREGCGYTPDRSQLFRALSLCSRASCRVAFIGQDPYPNASYATGVAFSIRDVQEPGKSKGDLGEPAKAEGNLRNGVLRVPPSLYTILKELKNDLFSDIEDWWPKTGNLENWCRQGVLLWNAMPVYPPIADFGPLTQEIVERLSAKGQIVFVFCGRKAQEYAQYVDPYNNRSIFVSHPSPRGNWTAKNRFSGSRVFSTINAHLNFYLKEPIDWTL